MSIIVAPEFTVEQAAFPNADLKTFRKNGAVLRVGSVRRSVVPPDDTIANFENTQ